MHRFYCPDLPSSLSTGTTGSQGLSDTPAFATLDRDQAHHARRVLRLGEGEVIELFNGNGVHASASIENWSNPPVLRLLSLHQTPPPARKLELAVCLPKGPRSADMVNQLSQLGVDRLIPLVASRSVVQPGQHRMDRLAAAAMESAKQCRRDYLMDVSEPTRFMDAIAEGCRLNLIADPDGETIDPQGAESVRVLIGPEGGFTDEETAAAIARGYRRWRFSPHILRIETAAGAAAAILRYQLA